MRHLKFGKLVLITAAVLLLGVGSACQVLPLLQDPLLTTYQGDEFSLRYPAAWQPLEGRKPVLCGQPTVDCLLALGTSDQDGSNLTLNRYLLLEDVSLAQVDEYRWNQFTTGTEGVMLASREDLEVDGLPAVKRVINAPGSTSGAGRSHYLTVALVKDSWYYQFTGWSPSEEALQAHEADFMEVINSLRFTR